MIRYRVLDLESDGVGRDSTYDHAIDRLRTFREILRIEVLEPGVISDEKGGVYNSGEVYERMVRPNALRTKDKM